MIENVSKMAVVEGGDIRFITDIGRTVARDVFFAGIAIKCIAHISRLGFRYAIS